MLVTHWSISDQTSAFLVADTLRRLAAGEEAVRLYGGLALRCGAQLGIIDRAGKDLPANLAHPFYWAPFALIGEGRSGGGAGAARGECSADTSRRGAHCAACTTVLPVRLLLDLVIGTPPIGAYHSIYDTTLAYDGKNSAIMLIALRNDIW